VASAPFSVSDETITTATGRSTIMSERAVMPSISGMLMSSDTTETTTIRLRSSASRGGSANIRRKLTRGSRRLRRVMTPSTWDSE